MQSVRAYLREIRRVYRLEEKTNYMAAEKDYNERGEQYVFQECRKVMWNGFEGRGDGAASVHEEDKEEETLSVSLGRWRVELKLDLIE